MFPLAARRRAAMCLMHMAGTPKTMQTDPHYTDVVAEVRAFLAGRIDAAVAAGIDCGRIVIDPGIGFGKRTEHNLALLASVGILASLGRPVLVGPSRKRFLGELTGETSPSARLSGTLAACLAARAAGAGVFRVHDVAAVRQGLAVFDAVRTARK
ncbi:MAG: dihydropteroate synthase [Planctomycetota bacterium]|nr:dihydropteroate synthase [Planctomycetota bacterium]